MREFRVMRSQGGRWHRKGGNRMRGLIERAIVVIDILEDMQVGLVMHRSGTFSDWDWYYMHWDMI